MSCGSQSESSHQSHRQPPCLQNPVASVCPVEPGVMLHSPAAALRSPRVGAFWKHNSPSLFTPVDMAVGWTLCAPSPGSALPLLTLTGHCAEHLPCCVSVARREESIAGRPGPPSSGKPCFCPAGQPAPAPGAPAGQALPCRCARCPCRPPSLRRSPLQLIASPSCLSALRKSALCCWQLICWGIRSAS